MFYKFNQMTQSIISTTQEMSMGQFLSQKPIEPTVIHSDHATQQAPRGASTSAVQQTGPHLYRVPNSSTYRKLMDMQTKFTAQDGKLVWQKLPKDMPVYYTLIGLVSLGFGLTVYSIYKLATPPKND